MKRIIFIITASLLFIIGVIVLLYPYISNWLAERNQSRAIQEYVESVSGISEEILREERQKAELYNESIINLNANVNGYLSFLNQGDTNISDDYFTILNTKGIMGYISIPQIDVSLPIYHGTSDNVLVKGIGHIINTALPIGGNGNHTVLTGHSGLPSAKLFNNLEKLDIGDTFYIHVLEETLAYTVDNITVIEPTNGDFLISDQDQDYVSLVTCTPYGVNSHRLVVRGTRTPYIEEAEETEEVVIIPISIEPESWGYMTAVIIFMFLVAIIHISTLHVVNNPKKIPVWIFVTLLFISGSCLLAYPSVTRYCYEEEVAQINSTYMERMKQMEKSAHVTYMSDTDEYIAGDESAENMADYIYKQMVQYNKRLYEENQAGLLDATSYETAAAELKDFGYNENMIGYIKINKMNVELPIYLGASEENMKKGSVHMTNTSLPIGGENTNAVIAAHRGISSLPMFKNIEKLEIGDEVIIVNFYEELIYKVSRIDVIDPSNKEDILIQQGRDMVTLLTCHPYGHNYKRYVVYCDRQ